MCSQHCMCDLQTPLPFDEFEIRLEDVEICKRADGSLWNLGQGSYGTGMEAWPCLLHFNICAFGVLGQMMRYKQHDRAPNVNSTGHVIHCCHLSRPDYPHQPGIHTRSACIMLKLGCNMVLRAMLMNAVYKALKGVETVAVKSCQSLVSEKDQVGRGTMPCRDIYKLVRRRVEAMTPAAVR